jgi:hypothetical protein
LKTAQNFFGQLKEDRFVVHDENSRDSTVLTIL